MNDDTPEIVLRWRALCLHNANVALARAEIRLARLFRA